MNYLPKLLLIMSLIVLSFSCFAQDKIYKTDGGIIDAHVKTVGTSSIIFMRADKPDGPEYTILKREVARIVYQNGTTDVFNGAATDERTAEKRSDKKYGNNFFSVTPAAYTVSPDGSMNDVGIGLTYELLVDKRGHIGLNLPVMLNFTSNRDFNNYLYYGYGGNNAAYSGNYHSFFFTPGIKVYPAPSGEAVRYSLGASFFCALGSEPRAVYDYNNYSSNPAPTGTYHYSIFGLMFSNSVNITAGKHIYTAIDLAAGIPFSDNRHANRNDAIDILFAPFIQFGFKVGVRY